MRGEEIFCIEFFGKEAYIMFRSESSSPKLIIDSHIADRFTDDEMLDIIKWFRDDSAELLFYRHIFNHDLRSRPALAEKFYKKIFESRALPLGMKHYAVAAIHKYQTNRDSLQKICSGYVYLLKGPSGYYKIGRTSNPDNRIATFSIKLPFEVEYEHIIQAYDMIGAERFFHEHFEDKRINGEWFNLSEEEVKYMRDIRQL